MKKVIVLGITLLILVTGCGSSKEEKMVCTRTSTMNGIDMNLHYEVYYQGNNVNKVKTIEKITSDSEEDLKTLEKQTKAVYSNFDNIEHYKYKVVIKENTLIGTTDINYEKIDINQLLEVDSSIKNLLNDNNKIDLDKITQVYEQTGATCEK